MKENNNLHIGIDVGSTTVKLAILDEANDVKFAVYRRHHADVRATIVEVLEEAAVDFGPERMTIAITGSVSYTHLDVYKRQVLRRARISHEADAGFEHCDRLPQNERSFLCCRTKTHLAGISFRA